MTSLLGPSFAPVTLNAHDVPELPAPPTSLLDTSRYDKASVVAKQIAFGDTTEMVQKINQNAVFLDALARGLGYAIIDNGNSPLALSAVDLTLTVAPGQALLDNVITVPVPNPAQNILPKTLVLTINSGRVYIWLKRDLTLVPRYNDTTPPSDMPAIYLGSAQTNASQITSLDASGVVYLRGPALWRQTADVGAPQDTPPSSLSLYTRTQGGLFLWDGVAHLPIFYAPALAPDLTTRLQELEEIVYRMAFRLGALLGDQFLTDSFILEAFLQGVERKGS